MPFRHEKTKHPPDRRQRACDRPRRDSGRAKRLKVADDVNWLDGVELSLLIGEPMTEMTEIGLIRGQRILRQPFLDREVIEKDRQPCQKVRSRLFLLGII